MVSLCYYRQVYHRIKVFDQDFGPYDGGIFFFLGNPEAWKKDEPVT